MQFSEVQFSDVRFSSVPFSVQAHPSLREHATVTVNATAGDGGAGPCIAALGASAPGGGMPGRLGPPADVIDQKLERFMQDNGLNAHNQDDHWDH